MSRILDSLYDGFPVSLVFSKSSGIAAGADNVLTLPGGNGFIVPEGYKLHPLLLSAVNSYSHYDALNGNPGFEVAGAGGADVFGSWTEAAGNGAIAAETGEGNFSEGAKSAKLTTGEDTLVKLTQDVAVKPGVYYYLQISFKADGTNIPRAAVYDKTNGANIIELGEIKESVLETPGWETYTLGFTAPAGCLAVTITLAGAAVEGAIVYFDEVKVWVSNAPATPTAQYWVSVDERNGSYLHYSNMGTVASATSLNPSVEDGCAFDQSPIPAGSEIKITMRTTSLFAETAESVDVVLLGVLVHD